MSPKSVLLLLICSCVVLGLTNATALDQIGARNCHQHTYGYYNFSQKFATQ